MFRIKLTKFIYIALYIIAFGIVVLVNVGNIVNGFVQPEGWGWSLGINWPLLIIRDVLPLYLLSFWLYRDLADRPHDGDASWRKQRILKLIILIGVVIAGMMLFNSAVYYWTRGAI